MTQSNLASELQQGLREEDRRNVFEEHSRDLREKEEAHRNEVRATLEPPFIALLDELKDRGLIHARVRSPLLRG